MNEPLDALVERRVEDRVVESGVGLEQRVRVAVEVADPADDRREVDHVGAASGRRGGLARIAQVAGVDLARLAHPGGRLELVRDPHLPLGVADQPPDDGGADGPGTARDEHSPHGGRLVKLGGETRRCVA